MVLHASETYNSLGLLVLQAPYKHLHSARDVPGRCGDSSGATGAGFGLALPVDGPLDTAPNCEAMIPKAKATAGEQIRILCL